MRARNIPRDHARRLDLALHDIFQQPLLALAARLGRMGGHTQLMLVVKLVNVDITEQATRQQRADIDEGAFVTRPEAIAGIERNLGCQRHRAQALRVLLALRCDQLADQYHRQHHHRAHLHYRQHQASE
ncbi:MAG: hypothetical protein O2845_06275 [Proteobacteria bacterium]|nr:hypothetical protein [Pseudomonadota bacterium]